MTTMGTHVSLIFWGYNPYIGGFKPSFFMVLGSKGSWWLNHNPFEKYPSRKFTYPTKREVRKIIDSKCPFLGGYVSSLEGMLVNLEVRGEHNENVWNRHLPKVIFRRQHLKIHETQKKKMWDMWSKTPCSIPWNWLVNRDPYNGLLQSLYHA